MTTVCGRCSVLRTRPNSSYPLPLLDIAWGYGKAWEIKKNLPNKKHVLLLLSRSGHFRGGYNSWARTGERSGSNTRERVPKLAGTRAGSIHNADVLV